MYLELVGVCLQHLSHFADLLVDSLGSDLVICKECRKFSFDLRHFSFEEFGDDSVQILNIRKTLLVLLFQFANVGNEPLAVVMF